MGQTGSDLNRRGIKDQVPMSSKSQRVLYFSDKELEEQRKVR